MASINIKKDGQWTGKPVLGFKVGEENLTDDLKEKIANGADVDLSDYATKEEVEALTAADVGARPDDWMPNALQVGAVPTSRKVNGKALSADIDLNAADVGAAPAGYGLGTNWGYSVTDANEALLSGVYACADPANCTNFPTNDAQQYGPLVVFRRASNISQTIYFRNRKVCRFSEDNGATWTSWEWENPPMVVGVEYRTTERWNGQPVYTKLVNGGALVASGSFSTGIYNARIVDAKITMANMWNGYHNPAYGTTINTWDFVAWTNLQFVWYTAGSDLVAGGGDVYALMKYVYY
jgi:hypothetical protein